MNEEWEDIDWPDLDRELPLREKLSMARPREQVELLRPLVEKYKCERCGDYGLLETEGLINLMEAGVCTRGEFDSIVEKLLHAIEETQNRPLVSKGKAFTNEYKPKRGRLDALGRLIKKTLADFRTANQRYPSAKELWAILPEGREGGTIQEKDEDLIYWINDRGLEKKTSFHRLENRLSKIKNS